MNINGVTSGYSPGYENRRPQKIGSGKSFASEVTAAAKTNGPAILHGSDEETGDIAISSWADMVTGSSTTVYKTPDFDPEHPVYKVKTWDAGGNVTERMVDISEVNPENSDTLEMYAYTSHLQSSGDFKGALTNYIVAMASNRTAQQRQAGYDSLTEKVNWMEIIRDIIQTHYRTGNLKEYTDWKNFYDFLKQ